ncbi:MAG: cytochrome c maturation protein CcmE [Ilumatobacteraceae bacterium]
MSSPDLTPRPTESHGRSKRRVLPTVVLALAVVAGGVVITQALSTAVDYYCNVDEVGVRSGCDMGRRLRIQGTVGEGSVVVTTGATLFDIEFNGSTVQVEYAGEPGGIFKECLPVVVHGVFNEPSGMFLGDRVEVKHSEDYVAVNDDRLQEAEADSAACETSA